MATFKKTIVLCNTTNSNFKGNAILTLNKSGDGIYGTFKAFNINNSPNLVLGISQNGKQVLKQNISLLNNNIYNFKLNTIDLDQSISCVLVEDEPYKVIPLCWGSDSYKHLTEEIVDNLNKLKTPKQSQISQTINLNEMFNDTEAEIENTITEELNFEELKQENIITNNLDETPQNIEITYADSFNPFTQRNESISKILTNKNIIDQEVENLNLSDTDTFYNSISDQIEDLFSTYPAETDLESLIPNSKWVKIDYENNGNPYVLGLIYEDINLKYICYGVPGKYSETPPSELDNYSQWLPTDINNPQDQGYWVMYQNALTGESILIDAI